MAASQMSKVIQQLHKALLVHDAPGMTDGQLLDCFASRREPAALEALVRRHGPMVWGVCRRVLSNYHDAEDAFQATFLVLVRKAARIRPRELVGNWLYGVAHQTALKARATAGKRKEREQQESAMTEPAVLDQETWTDLQPVLDQELSRLPEKYRVVIVLCDLEGKTREEAAGQLGWPAGTVAGRLARARTMLARRLTQRGVGLSGGALAALLTHQSLAASVPAPVLTTTLRNATLVAGGQAGAGLVSARIAGLVEGVVRMMLLTKLKTAMTVLVALSLLGLGGGLLFQRPAAAQPSKEKESSKIQQDVGELLVAQGGNPGPVIPQSSENLQKTFEKAMKQIVALENKHPVLQGISQAKPQIEQDAKGLKQASFEFERNTMSNGKPPPPARDPSQPHFYLAVSLWRGAPSSQPPPGIFHFRVQGEDYHLIVMVGGSDSALVKHVHTIFQDLFGPLPAALGPGKQLQGNLGKAGSTIDERVIKGVVQENDGHSILLKGGERVWFNEQTKFLRETGDDPTPVKCADVITGTLVYIGTKGQGAKIVARIVVIEWIQPPKQKAKNDKIQPLAHEGKAINGLRLEVKAQFLPEQPAWGAPKLETTYIFHNETDKVIVLDGYFLYGRLVLARLGPADTVEARLEGVEPLKLPPPQATDLIRIAAHGKYTLSRWCWCNALTIPFGTSVDGKVVDGNNGMAQVFHLKGPGERTLAYLYRSDGYRPVGIKELEKFLKPGETLWSGRVYSNPVIVNFAPLPKKTQ